jgi:hypothetical protein
LESDGRVIRPLLRALHSLTHSGEWPIRLTPDQVLKYREEVEVAETAQIDPEKREKRSDMSEKRGTTKKNTLTESGASTAKTKALLTTSKVPGKQGKGKTVRGE